jgi:transglutaminase-like putative cysteine protease
VSVEVAVHGGRGRRGLARSRLDCAAEVERPLIRLATFTALALYGALRWATLEQPGPGARLAGLLALAILVAGAGPWLDKRSRPLAAAGAAFAVFAMLAICGIPVSWLIHGRVAVITQGIGLGLSALPGALVPYIGIDAWVRVVIALGAGVLLLDAAIMIAFAPNTLGDLRRAAAALPLIALAVVPATLVHPQLPYVQGFVLFALVAAFMWGERVAAPRAGGAVAVAGAAGLAAAIIAPGLDEHHAWVNYQGLANSLAPSHVDTFDWTQRYGPFSWSRADRDVLDVQAARADYWKAENLDVFNGVGWGTGSGVTGSRVPGPSPASLRRWTQTIQVTIRALSTTELIAGGVASRPEHVGQAVVPGISAGTWVTGAALQPGDTYTVSTYSPDPTAAELRRDNGAYPVANLADELTIGLPWRGLQTGAPDEVQFPVFHSGGQVQNVIGPANVPGRLLIDGSPYERAYALARVLARQAATPFAFVQAVERYLASANGFSYDEDPPRSPYPIESFLFSARRGYCQQFAGAMALLLRMGGLPARVAAGFATGDYEAALHQYVVSDTDAHAWVEVWFPGYGWVRFDPTPVVAPARSGSHASLPALSGTGGNRSAKKSRARGLGGTDRTSAGPSSVHRVGGGVPVAALIVGVLAVGALGALALGAFVTAPATEQRLVAELERALARTGRPLVGGVTLQALEHRLRSSPEAQAYVRALRLARFGGASELPDARQRRALRAYLGAGLGLIGRLRAWWALPPRGLH